MLGRQIFLVAILLAWTARAQAQSFIHMPYSTVQDGKCSRELLEVESVYTFESGFRDSRLGQGSSAYNDISYSHRFRVDGNWYLRLGAEYERFDFGGSDNGMPDKLQAVVAQIAFEYIIHDRAGAGIGLQPGFYFQNRLRADAFDMPWKIFAGFPLKKDKVFAFIGLGGSFNQDPMVGPGGGIVWLINDRLRLEGVFPKPALVYEPTDNWQFRLVGNITAESFRTERVATAKFELNDAILQYSEYRIGLQASYTGFARAKINAGIGCTLFREFDFFRADQREKTEPAPYARVSVEAKF